MVPHTIAYKCLKRAISRGDRDSFDKYFDAAGVLPAACTKSALEKAVEKERRDFIYRLAPIEAHLCKNEYDVLEIVYPMLLGTAAQTDDRAAIRKWSWLCGHNGMRDSALMQAARAGRREAFDLLFHLERLKIAGGSKRTSLMAAAEGGDAEMVRRLIQDDEDQPTPLIGRTDRRGRTALMVAAEVGNGDVVNTLLASSAGARELRMQDEEGTTALMLAAQGGFADVAARLMHEGEGGIVNHKGLTALHFAIMESREDIATLLVMAEGYVDTARPALLLALDNGLATTATTLLPFQAHNHLSDRRVRELVVETMPSAEMAAAVADREASVVLALFSQKSDYKATLVEAVLRNELEAVQRALHCAGSVPPGFRTALQVAAEHGRLDIARLLAPREAGMQDATGTTAMMDAAMVGSESPAGMIQLLFDKEAGLVDNKGRTALMMAVSARAPETVRQIASLDAAQAEGNPDAYRELGVADQFGMTALMYAAAIGSDTLLEVVPTLVAEAKLRDLKGRTALDHAVARNRTAFIAAYKAAVGTSSGSGHRSSGRRRRRAE